MVLVPSQYVNEAIANWTSCQKKNNLKYFVRPSTPSKYGMETQEGSAHFFLDLWPIFPPFYVGEKKCPKNEMKNDPFIANS